MDKNHDKLQTDLTEGIDVIMPNLQKKVENCLEQNDIYQKLPGRIEELMRKEAYDI